MISTLVAQAQKAVGKRFFVTAFLPTVVVAVVAWIQIAGLDEVRETLEAWAGQAAGRALFDVAATVVTLFLAAYVLDSLRWTLRALFEGSWPAPFRNARERCVLRHISRRDQREAALQSTLDAAQAVEWLRGMPPPEIEPARLTSNEASKAMRTASQGLTALEGKAGHRAIEAVVRGASSLLVLDASRNNLDENLNSELDALCRRATALRSNPGPKAILRLAAVRLEQRRIWFDERLEFEFPDEADIRPTRLGNAMARADGYSAARYGIPLRELWPRLDVVVPDRALDKVEDSLSRVDFGLAMTTGGAAIFVVGIVSWATSGPIVAPLAGLAALVGSVLAYRFAVVSAEAYTLRIAAVVDAHRRSALEALGVDPPPSLAAEREIWEGLYIFFSRADPFKFQLSAPSKDRKADGTETQ